MYINDPDSQQSSSHHYYRTASNMNNQNLSTNQLHWIAPRPTAPGQFVPTENTKENHLDKAYVTSIRGVLKFACLLFAFIAFVCIVATAQCSGNHIFLATVIWLVIIMQVFIIVCFIFRLKDKFPAIDFDFVDFFATSHDALYLLIASSVTIHYCRIPGQIAGGVMGIFAFLFLAADAVAICLSRRQEPSPPTISQNVR